MIEAVQSLAMTFLFLCSETAGQPSQFRRMHSFATIMVGLFRT